MIVHCDTALAGQNSDITFKWKANPSDENIVGYKLYYGNKSRFNANGSEKASFQYDYCIDFAELVRCSGTNYSSCVDLGIAQLDCENLYTATPKCTLKNLKGNNYFTLTAYNNQKESGFSDELQKISSVALSSVYKILLE